MKWPNFNFRDLPLSPSSRAQLAGIYEPILAGKKIPSHRSHLLSKIILKNIYDLERGTYVPVSNTLRLKRKLPTFSQRLVGWELKSEPFPSPYFGNALAIPEHYGTAEFDEDAALAPLKRTTNIGFLIATIEIDCTTAAQLDENLGWTRGADDDFKNSALFQVEAELCRFKDYRGHSVVFSGNKSLHFNFIFSTTHLENAPADSLAADRLRDEDSYQSALLQNAHEIYWDTVQEIFVRQLDPQGEVDPAMRSVTQWRRSPWAV